MNDISVIMINYNSSKFTLESIAAVDSQTNASIKYEIIVVDNNSELDDYMYLHENFPNKSHIKLYRSSVNTGFGGGNMFGAQYANSKYLLFLNNDTVLQNDCLDILLRYMESNLKVGVATAQNYNEHGEHVACIEHFKGIRKLLFGRSILEKFWPKQHPKRKQHYQNPVTANTVNGAFMFFRTAAFAQTGGFDNNIFLYFEEMDICYRLLKLGYASVLVPEAKVVHYQGKSIDSSPVIDRESFLSYLYVLQKNYSWAKYQFIRSYLILTFLIKPKKWKLYPVALRGADLSQSLKQKQEIRYYNSK